MTSAGKLRRSAPFACFDFKVLIFLVCYLQVFVEIGLVLAVHLESLFVALRPTYVFSELIPEHYLHVVVYHYSPTSSQRPACGQRKVAFSGGSTVSLFFLILSSVPLPHKKETIITRKQYLLAFFDFFSFVSDIIEPDFFRKVKDKRPSTGSTAGQILPVISDKSSHVTQVQGSRQDQIGKRRTLIFCRRGEGLGVGQFLKKEVRNITSCYLL